MPERCTGSTKSRLGITVVYVLGGAVDSVGHLKEYFGALGRDVNYVIVKNYGVAGKFDLYDQSNVRKDLLAVGAREIAFPCLDGSVYQSVDPPASLSRPSPMGRTTASGRDIGERRLAGDKG